MYFYFFISYETKQETNPTQCHINTENTGEPVKSLIVQPERHQHPRGNAKRNFKNQSVFAHTKNNIHLNKYKREQFLKHSYIAECL